VRVHQDILLTPKMLLPAREAVYLLPARTRYEHEGGVTETTTERRVIFSPFIPGHEVAEARDEWRILLDIVKAARPDLVAHLHYSDTAAIRHDIAQTVPAYEGIEKLAQKGDAFQWGGPHLCAGGRFGHPDGLARFTTAEPRDRTLPEGAFHLATRRGKQFNSMVQATNDGLTGADRDHVLISGEDMQRLGLGDHEPIRIVSEHGSVEARAFRAAITPGNLQMHWPEANPLLDPSRIDPGGLVPDYNTVVRIERLAPH
jgi:anaerobic selenocysteine-containing dehydrogenase